MNTAWASAAVRRRHEGSSRSQYHAWASAQAVESKMTAPTARPRSTHQRLTSSSDRKSRIVAQVKPMSSHQEAAGTAKCTTPDPAHSACPVVRMAGGSPQSAQLVMISAGA